MRWPDVVSPAASQDACALLDSLLTQFSPLSFQQGEGGHRKAVLVADDSLARQATTAGYE
jgi:hypothetical protein